MSKFMAICYTSRKLFKVKKNLTYIYPEFLTLRYSSRGKWKKLILTNDSQQAKSTIFNSASICSKKKIDLQTGNRLSSKLIKAK